MPYILHLYIFNNHKMINLLAFMVLLNLARSEAPLSSCFHNQKFKISNSTPFTNLTTGYIYSIPWTQPQGNITKSSYTLLGFFTGPTINQLAFNASLVNLSSSGGTFIFDPQPLSSISYMHFSIILFCTCSGYIQLQYIEFVPAQFNLTTAFRTLNSATWDVTVQKNFTPDLSNYKAYAFISAFHLVQISSSNMYLKAEPNLITPAANIHKISFYSPKFVRNRYERIWFTYLLIYLPLFQQQISFYFTKYDFAAAGSTGNQTIATNFDIPANFNPNFTSKCLIALSFIYSYRANIPNQMNFEDLGNTSQSLITSLAHQYFLTTTYQIFCLQQCSVGESIDKDYSTYLCIKCNNTIPFCQKCFYGNLTINFNIVTVNTTNKTLFCKKCQTNYFLLSTVNTCYLLCPIGYYGNNATGICLFCNSVCQSCVDNLNCVTCKIGWPVDEGCTTIDGCVKALSPVICSKCSDSMHFVLNGGTCSCAANYYLVSHLCVNVFGCAGAAVSGNSTVCVLCNSIFGFVMDNGSCRCKDGYIFDTTNCKEICGDGKLIEYQCDDGNTVSGDGCSSECKVQANYQCSGGSITRPSKCLYLKSDINISIVDIQKADLSNQGIFTIQITPQTGNMALLNFASAVKFECSQSISVNYISYSNRRLIISVQYFEALQGFPAIITLSLDSSYFVQPSATIAFNMTSNGNKLTLTSNLAFVKTMFLIVSTLDLIVFALSLFVHKMIGIELLMPFQVIYLIHLVNNKYTQQYALLRYIAYTSWNFLGITQGSNVATVSSNEPFSSSSQSFTLKIMIGLAIFILASFVSVLVIKAVKSQQDQTKPLKILEKILLLIYNQLLFPITIGFSFVFLIMINTIRLQGKTSISYIIKNLQSLFMVLLSFVFFFQWKALFIFDAKDPFLGVEKCYKRYIAFFISIFYITTKVICFSCYHPQFDATTPVLGLQLILLIWLIIYRPYEGRIHNAGVVINLLPSITFLSWNLVRQKLGLFQNQQMELLLVFILLITFLVSIIMSIIRIVYQLRMFKKERQVMISLKAQKKHSKRNRKENLLKQIENARMNINNNEFEASCLQQFRKMKDEQFSNGKNNSLLAIQAYSDRADRKNSSVYLKKLNNRLGQLDFQTSRKKLLHL